MCNWKHKFFVQQLETKLDHMHWKHTFFIQEKKQAVETIFARCWSDMDLMSRKFIELKNKFEEKKQPNQSMDEWNEKLSNEWV